MPTTLPGAHLYDRTVFEYDTVQLDDLPDDDRREVLSAVEGLPKPNGEEVIQLTVFRSKVALQTTQFVGLFQLGPLRLQVLPKIYRSDAHSAEARRQAASNLSVMLRYGLDLPVHIGELSALDVGADWFETLTTLFTRRLMTEWQRGPIRRYETIHEDLSTVRGRLRIAEHIRCVGRQHVLPVEFDELMADTELNRLFRFVVARLQNIARTTENIVNLRILAAWMDEDGITLPHGVDKAHASRLTLDRLQARYDLPFALAKLFLHGNGLFTHEGSYAGLAMFFDMNDLFEAFLTGILLQHRTEILTDRLNDTQILPQGYGDRRPLLIHEFTQKGTVYMKPDVILKNDRGISMIIDFKYKNLDFTRERLGVSSDDLYQMFAYSQIYKCTEILLIFPSTSTAVKMGLLSLHSNVKSRFTISSVNLMVNLCEEKELNELIDQLNTTISQSLNMTTKE